ncbi:glycosyltransferase [Mesobacillus subterraneus]|uniref:Spore protein YkvP/CgeB glycosyl transferase-like domain-containing protein n=1 Tax=Mesobacillus subterraneus TaxID=285983 RepID=A0A0D6Z4I4_9BACI|nr:glycosyltransferase [Mesobacillus subterraneus]KIY20624.1 hypothetical protein UB32_18300 [Mesobacillus subterraneus]
MIETLETNGKLNILFLTKNFENRMEKSSKYLADELSKYAFLVQYGEDGNIHEILAELGFTPDFILLNDFKYDYCPFVWGFADLDIPVGAIVHDIKYKLKHRKNFYEKENIRYLFTHYRNASYNYLPEFRERFIWTPHHVPTDIFYDYQLEKEIDFLMIGAIFPKLYPERVKMLEIMQREKGFVYFGHPGYKDLSGKEAVLIGEAYAKQLNKAKIFLTCDSVEHFPLMKYFEALASNTLLLASASDELTELGFVDGETFVSVTSDNVREKALYFLENEQERRAIAQAGFKMVNSRHTTEKRAKELLKKIEEIVTK